MHRLFLVLMSALLVAACGPRLVRTPHAPPAVFQLNVSKLSRVWVAGFVAGRNPEVDVNVETVRFLRRQLRTQSSVTVVDAEPLTLDTEQRFSETTYWRRLGEEHGSPLIVTGSVRLLLAPPAMVQRGPRSVYIPTAGRVLEATVVLIDGRTGTALSTQKLPSRMRYGLGRFSSGLSLYLQLMDRAMPDWFRAIAATPPAAASSNSADR